MKADKPATKEVKKPIPTSISAVAYITQTGHVRYTTCDKNKPLPSDFKAWVAEKRSLESDPSKCPVCGNRRTVGNHQKCSRITKLKHMSKPMSD